MQDHTQLNLKHLVRMPVEQERGNTGMAPGLLLLHGRGADEADLMGIESALDPRLTIVSPRAPFRAGPGFAWYGMNQTGIPDGETLQASIDALQEFIAGMLPLYSINPQKLFLMGFSQGAVVSAGLALAGAAPGGVIMHSGYVPTQSELGEPAHLRDMPFFVAHGQYDDVIPVRFGRSSRDYLAQHGADLTYHEYPTGHTISEESLYEASSWLTAQIGGAQQKGGG